MCVFVQGTLCLNVFPYASLLVPCIYFTQLFYLPVSTQFITNSWNSSLTHSQCVKSETPNFWPCLHLFFPSFLWQSLTNCQLPYLGRFFYSNAGDIFSSWCFHENTGFGLLASLLVWSRVLKNIASKHSDNLHLFVCHYPKEKKKSCYILRIQFLYCIAWSNSVAANVNWLLC